MKQYTDQAATLRRLSPAAVVPIGLQRDRAVAVTGGKGGIGKSTIAVNLAMAYARQGARVLAVDTDLGMADMNLLLGVAPKKSLHDLVNGATIDDVLIQAHGIHLLPALNGSDALENMDSMTRTGIFACIESVDDRFDTLIVDVAAGVGRNQTSFAGAVSDTIVVATPEALSLADAYSCLKVLALRQGLKHAFVLPNRVRSKAQADEVVARLTSLVTRFLDVKITELPHIPFDNAVADAAAAGVPLVVYSPDSPASRAIKHVARRLDSLSQPDKRQGVVRLFWRSAFTREGGAR